MNEVLVGGSQLRITPTDQLSQVRMGLSSLCLGWLLRRDHRHKHSHYIHLENLLSMPLSRALTG